MMQNAESAGFCPVRVGGVLLVPVLMFGSGCDARYIDADGDGYTVANGDCDDEDAQRHPGVVETGSEALLEDPSCDGNTGSLADADYGWLLTGETWSGLASGGDVDGDGIDDIIVGAKNYAGSGRSVGKAYVFLGSTLASSEGTDLDLDDADYSFVGTDTYDYLGTSISLDGDIDGDGLDDILIWSNSSYGYVFLGRNLGDSQTISLSSADYRIAAENGSDEWGVPQALSTGDVDGDGLSDVLIGAGKQNDWLGKAYLILGATLLASPSTSFDVVNADFVFVGEQAQNRSGGWAGTSVEAAGDVDGDGLDDILVGAPEYDDARPGTNRAGKVYVVFGSTLAAAASSTIELAESDVSLVPEGVGDKLGSSLEAAGDIDGDGLDDIVVAGESGPIEVVLGKTIVANTEPEFQLAEADYRLQREPLDSSFEDTNGGLFVVAMGDVDGDGLSDVLAASGHTFATAGAERGKVYLMLGNTLSNLNPGTVELGGADFVFLGEPPEQANNVDFAISIGDANGDGRSDLFIGDTINRYDDGYVGKAYVIQSRL